jgi:hypothetical protein
VWAVNVGDLLKLQPGCSRTTCYIHASTTIRQAAAEQQGHSDSSAPAPAPPQETGAAADVRVSVAEPEAPVAFWPTEGVAALQHEKAALLAAASPPQAADQAAAAKLGPGSVPDVQLLLADPRNINFADPKLQISSPTSTGGHHTSNGILTSHQQLRHTEMQSAPAVCSGNGSCIHVRFFTGLPQFAQAPVHLLNQPGCMNSPARMQC